MRISTKQKKKYLVQNLTSAQKPEQKKWTKRGPTPATWKITWTLSKAISNEFNFSHLQMVEYVTSSEAGQAKYRLINLSSHNKVIQNQSYEL